MSIADKLTTIAENEAKVFDAGYQKGIAEGGGDDSFHEAYWNTRTTSNSYIGAFHFWTSDLFKPKRGTVIAPTNAYYMFSNFKHYANNDAEPDDFDLEAYLKANDVTLDFSNCTNFQNFLMWSTISRIGVIDTRKASSVGFYVAYRLEQIDELILKEDGSQTFDMRDMSRLKRINILTGTIGKSINFNASKDMEKDTIVRIIEHLSSTSTNQTFTIPKVAINNAFGINIDDASTHTEEWTTLRNSKSNWNFSFV